MRLPDALAPVNHASKYFGLLKGQLNKKPTTSDKTQYPPAFSGRGAFIPPLVQRYQQSGPLASARRSLHPGRVIPPHKMKRLFSKKELFLREC
jgi:hypothetical protein